MPWTKIHTDILGDPKLLRAARKGARELCLLPWLFAFAKSAEDGGRLTIGGDPAEPIDIAPLIPSATPKRIARALKELHEIGVLTIDPDGAYRLAAWEKRAEQKPSDSKEAIRERVQRHRDTQRSERNAEHETPSNTPSNALQETRSNATEKRRGEENREEKKREDPVVPSAPRFEDAWGRYPQRAGGNPRYDAERAWNARVRDGVDPGEMVSGTERYAAWCEATGKLKTEYVMQAKKFFGPSRQFTEAWTSPDSGDLASLPSRQHQQLEDDARWLAQRQNGHGGPQ